MAVAHRGTSPSVPTYEGGRHQSAITHVSALNARRLQGPLVLLRPFTPLARRLPCPANSRHCKLDKVGQSVGPICSSAQREKRSRPPAAAFGQRRQLAQSNCCGQRKRQTAQLGSHARESERSLSLASLADRAWLCAADLLEHTLSRLTAFVDRESAMFWPRAGWRCHAIVHCWGDALD